MAKIPVVDDEPRVRELLTRLLEGCGHVVVEASNGQMALTFLESDRPDLVLIDLVMPVQEGLETIQELRKRDANVPVIAISGSDTAFLKAALLLGACRTLSKPFNLQGVIAAVDEELAKRPAA